MARGTEGNTPLATSSILYQFEPICNRTFESEKSCLNITKGWVPILVCVCVGGVCLRRETRR